MYIFQRPLQRFGSYGVRVPIIKKLRYVYSIHVVESKDQIIGMHMVNNHFLHRVAPIIMVNVMPVTSIIKVV